MNEEFYEYLGQWFEWDRMKAAQNAISIVFVSRRPHRSSST